MTDVRPRWVHYRQQDHCALGLLQRSGRVASLVEPERFPGVCYAFFEVRSADRRPAHGAAGDAGTWHDLDECVPVPPPAPPAVDFATALAAMQAGRVVRDRLPAAGWRWRIRGDVFETERPGVGWREHSLAPSLITGPWYLDDGKGET